jgi:uncharacterized membrane protein SirB2
MRYQLVFFPLTLGMYLLWKRKWSGAMLFGIFFTLGFALTQIDNLLFWHKPIYQHLLDYQSYNATHFSDYPSNVFSYLALITYYIFPVVTIVFLISLRRRHSSSGHSSPTFVAPQHSDTLTIFIGVTVFILFHLVFPNRQERFLLPAVPFLLLLMMRAISKRYSCFAPSHEVPSSAGPSRTAHTAMRWSIYLSIVYTLGYSFFIPKSKYLEASYALYERGDFQNVVIDNWKGEESVWLPMHYVGKFVHPFSVTNKKSLDQLKQQITHQSFYDAKRLPAPAPNYLIIWGREEAYPRAKMYEESGFRVERLSSANTESEQGFVVYSLHLFY